MKQSLDYCPVKSIIHCLPSSFVKQTQPFFGQEEYFLFFLPIIVVYVCLWHERVSTFFVSSRILQCSVTVQLQKCLVDYDTSTEFALAWGKEVMA